MSMKQEIETWVQALEHYDNNEYDAALGAFMTIANTSKILFNCAVIHATLGEHAQAVQCYQRASHFDQYMAISYFQQGVSNFLLGDFEEALANFNDTLLYLRGNRWIDYDQLGLKFKLHSCEALFNRGLCYIYLQQRGAGLQDLFYASKEKAVPDHDVIDEAIRERAEGYTVFSIPVGTVYRPNEAKVKNIKHKNYLGSSTLVRANDAFGRLHMDPRRNLTASSFAVDDRPEDKLSYAAINLVRPGLASRSRQQSEPPIHRDLFPPTPPPEADTSGAMTNPRRRSPESTADMSTRMHQDRPPVCKPAKLDLGAAAFEQSPQKTNLQADKPRIGTKRSASERPRDRGLAMPQPIITRGGKKRHSLSNQATEEASVLKPDVYRPAGHVTARPESDAFSMQHRRTRSGGHSLREKPLSIAEEDESADEETVSPPRHLSTGSLQRTIAASLPYEIVSSASPSLSASLPVPSDPLSSSPSPFLRLRTKLHHPSSPRHIMSPPNITFTSYIEQIRKKFEFASTDSFRLKMKDDEGDFVVLGDEEDLEMLIEAAKESLKVEGRAKDVLKIEVWVAEA